MGQPLPCSFLFWSCWRRTRGQATRQGLPSTRSKCGFVPCMALYTKPQSCIAVEHGFSSVDKTHRKLLSPCAGGCEPFTACPLLSSCVFVAWLHLPRWWHHGVCVLVWCSRVGPPLTCVPPQSVAVLEGHANKPTGHLARSGAIQTTSHLLVV